MFSPQSCLILCYPMNCSTSGLPVPHHLPEFAQVHIHWIGEAIQPFHPLMPSSPSALKFPQHQEFSNELAVCIRWSKYWSFSFSISPSNEYSMLVSCNIDWFDLLVQGTLRSLHQHHNSKASALWCSAFFTVQLSQPYTTTGKTMTFIIQTFVSRVTSLLFNPLSRFVIAFLPRSKHLMSWLQLPSTVTLEPKKRKYVTASTFSPSICHEVMGPESMILFYLIFSFKPDFSLCCFILIKSFFSSSLLSAIRAVSSA